MDDKMGRVINMACGRFIPFMLLWWGENANGTLAAGIFDPNYFHLIEMSKPWYVHMNS